MATKEPTKELSNGEIADAFNELGTLYELDGAISYRVLAYREAAKVIRQSPVSIAELTRAGRVTELPGIGKTILWNAGVQRARERGYRVLHARPGVAERELSFAVLGDVLADVHDEVGFLPAPQRRALRIALLLEDVRGQPPELRAVGAALRGLLLHLAGKGPVLVAIDDAQWADPPSAAALRFALRRLDSSPGTSAKRGSRTVGSRSAPPMASIRPVRSMAIRIPGSNSAPVHVSAASTTLGVLMGFPGTSDRPPEPGSPGHGRGRRAE